MKKAQKNKQAVSKRKLSNKSEENQSYQQILKEKQRNLKQVETAKAAEEK